MFGLIDSDGPSPSNEHVNFRVPFADRGGIVRNRLVRIQDADAGRAFLGRICDGPFYPPAATDAPREALARIEVQGEYASGRLGDTSTRPAPGSSVVPLSDDDVAGLVGCDGDLVLGFLSGHQGVPLRLRSNDKAVLPRNLGVFGTVGSGKSNTCQVMIEEVSRAGWAVVVVDVEGEYTGMNRSNPDPAVADVLRRLERPPAGVADFAVYFPASCPGEGSEGRPFTLRLADFAPPVIAELLEATAAERNALFECIDHFRSRNRTSLAVNEREELAGLLAAAGTVKLPFNVFALRERCVERSSRGGGPELDYVGLGTKLMRLINAQTFDEPQVPSLDVARLIVPGRVSVLDVSAASEVIQNLVTADVLRKAFAYKMVKDDAPPTLLIIEEAHSFINKGRAASLNATLEMLRTVTRRGRKRWLSVAFVSQQPGHLPSEVFELCNTRIIHNLRSMNNLDSLMATAGDVSQELWGRCPLLAPGEALVSSPQLRRPVIARVRPASSRRRFVR